MDEENSTEEYILCHPMISSSIKQSQSQLLKQDTAERCEQFFTQLKS